MLNARRAALDLNPDLRDDFDEPESDDDEEDGDDGAEGEVDDQELAEAQAREEAGPYVPPVGWHVLPAPASEDGGWQNMLPDYRWTKKRLAHYWIDHGWDVASCRGYDHRAKRSKFYYKSDKQTCMTHSLLIEDYGMTNTWVIIAMDS